MQRAFEALPSKSRHVDFISSGNPQFVATISSHPFCIYRNQTRYDKILEEALVGYRDEQGNVISSAREDSIRDLAPYRQSVVLKHQSSQREMPFTIRSVYNALKDEVYERPYDILQEKDHDTITVCYHYNKSLVLHVAGKFMDTLVLRETRSCSPGLQKGSPGFTLSLGKGEMLTQVMCVSTSRWNSCSHILARTENTLFHCRTISLSDEMPKAPNKLSIKGRGSVILEPLQQWQFPGNIINVSASPNNVSQALILCRGGKMYRWNLTEGVSELSCSPRLAPTPSLKFMPGTGKNKQKIDSSGSLEWLNICASTHPMTCYLTAGTDLYGVDMRSAAPPRLLFSDISRIAAMSQHPVSLNYVFMSSASKSIGVLDLRYPKKYALHKPIADCASTLNFRSTLDIEHPTKSVQSILHDDLNGILLSRSKRAKQILIHSIDLGMRDNNLARDSAIFSMSRPFETANSMANVETTGLPVIDRDSPHDRNCGAVIIPYSGQFKTKENIEGGEVDFEKVYNAVVLHQSLLGDVHAQRVFITVPGQTWGYYKRDGDGHPLNGKHNFETRAKNLIVDANEELSVPLKFSRRGTGKGDLEGLALRNNIFDLDCDTDEYPISRSEVIPPVPDNDRASHEIVDEGSPKQGEGLIIDADFTNRKSERETIQKALSDVRSFFDDHVICTLENICILFKKKYGLLIRDLNVLRDSLKSHPCLKETFVDVKDEHTSSTRDASLSAAITGQKKNKKMKVQYVRPERPKQCVCEGETVAAYDGICEKQYGCYRLYNYVYERVEVFEAMERAVSSAPVSSSSLSSSSSSSSKGANVIKVGEEEFDLRAMLARLRNDWNESVKNLNESVDHVE